MLRFHVNGTCKVLFYLLQKPKELYSRPVHPFIRCQKLAPTFHNVGFKLLLKATSTHGRNRTCNLLIRSRPPYHCTMATSVCLVAHTVKCGGPGESRTSNTGFWWSVINGELNMKIIKMSNSAIDFQINKIHWYVFCNSILAPTWQRLYHTHKKKATELTSFHWYFSPFFIYSQWSCCHCFHSNQPEKVLFSLLL